jgi:hypothetical protein
LRSGVASCADHRDGKRDQQQAVEAKYRRAKKHDSELLGPLMPFQQYLRLFPLGRVAGRIETGTGRDDA